VQDDFVALYRAEGIVATGERLLRRRRSRLILSSSRASTAPVVKPEAYLENVSQNDDGVIDFFDTGYTPNGRAVFPHGRAGMAQGCTRGWRPVDHFLILNRNDNLIPGVARLNREQAALYFMLGETRGTSAGGKEEAGKVPTCSRHQPILPRSVTSSQGNRFPRADGQQLLSRSICSTPVVSAATDDDERGKKVSIPYSSAIVKAISEWDHRVGARIPTSATRSPSRFPGSTTRKILQPASCTSARAAWTSIRALVERLQGRAARVSRHIPGLREEIRARPSPDPTTRDLVTAPMWRRHATGCSPDPQSVVDRSAPISGAEGFEGRRACRATHRCQPPVLQGASRCRSCPRSSGYTRRRR